MDRFVGCVHLAGGTIDPLFDEQARRAAASTPLHPGALQSGHALFVHSHSETGLLSGRGGRDLFAACARLDNRAELAEALGLPAAELVRTSDAALLLAMFERWGGDGVARCLGAFAFAHWDAEARRLTLGRDCLGHHSLLFHRNGDTVVFSNRLSALLAMPDVPRAIDELGVANFLVVNRREGRRTAYRGVERTPSRSLVTIDRSGTRDSPYWTPDFDAPPPYARDEDYIERARELFDQAVVSAAAGANEVAIATSGGLDSSAIAATMARLGSVKHIFCYTTLPSPDADVIVSPRLYRDERDKVEALGRMHPALDINFTTTEDRHFSDDDHAPYFAQALLPRFGGMGIGKVGFMIDTLSQYRLVLFGTRGNFGLTWTGQYSLLALLRGGHWGGFARELPLVARHSQRSVARTLISDVLRAGMPAGVRRLWHKIRGRTPPMARYSALNPDFVAQNDLARLWREQRFDPWFEQDGWNPARLRAWQLFDKAGADRDNPGWIEERYGLAVRDPHSDRRLLEFALAVPEPLYCRNGVPRSFARAVFADRLPREILSEIRRGSNNMAWFRKLDLKRPQIAAEIERLEASPAARCLIDLPRLKRLLAEWPKDEQAARLHLADYNNVLARGLHIGRFIRWVEEGNA